MSSKGFSLIEVLIAMSILTVGILAVVSMQTTALKVQSRNKLSANIQNIGQEIIERIISNSSDDQTVLSYNGIKTNDTTTKPATFPANRDFDDFRNILNKYPGSWAEISVTNIRPYPLKVTINWKEGTFNHKLEYSTYILPN
ncbi:MAG: type IV pilus modification protein PilV [Proteobacteria bacterium]|nr:type IV pilus modification protein PilV [Pseudomonadota bacterium]